MTDPSDFHPTLLLAGPVLRRVTATSVSVWVATSEPSLVQLDVYGSAEFLTRAATEHTGVVNADSIGVGTQHTVAVGTHLHIAVVTAQIPTQPPDIICSYNVTLTVDSGASDPFWSGLWDLGGLKLLDLGDPSDDYQGGLGYAEGHLPTFATAPVDIANLRLWHGSCFKMHGNGPSILGNLDDILSDALPADGTATKQRPHVLLLTGDQIYADDVATAVSPMLTTLGANLLGGGPETIPVPGASGGDVEVTQANFPAGRRMRLIRATAGMTSDDADNHLIGFGEFAALYLLCWTGRSKGRLWGIGGATASDAATYQPAWPVDLAVRTGMPADEVTKLKLAGPPTYVLAPGASTGGIESLLTPPLDGDGKVRLTELTKSYDTDRDAVGKVGDDGDKVRRALANIPVLTICDDHEVTDDWFITGAWRARVLGNTLGRSMIRNALVAYVLFQGWGNTPDRFAQAGTPEARFLQLIPQWFAGGGTVPDSGISAQLDTLLGLDDLTGGNGSDNPTQPGGPTRITFNHHLDIAGSRIVVLDTRTHREYGTPNGPPGLLAQESLDYQLPITLTDDVPTLIVVSPAPVIGPRVFEEIAAPLGTRLLDVQALAIMDQNKANAQGIDKSQPYGDVYLDIEFWSARPIAYERFLDRVTRCPQVVILAGDVHYAASYQMDYTRFAVPTSEGGVPPTDPPPLFASSRIVHFTASAIRNAWDWHVATITSSIGFAENLELAGFAGAALGWHRLDPPVFGTDLASGEARPLRGRLHREPVVLPTEGWAAQHTIRPPEWMYHVVPIADVRTDDVRFQDLTTLGFTHALGPNVPDIDPPPPDGATTTSWVQPGGPYSIATALHAQNVEGAVVTRKLVFFNNIGVVTFARADDSSLTAQMAVYFQRPHAVSDDEKPHAFVVHAASLTPVPLVAPGSLGGS